MQPSLWNLPRKRRAVCFWYSENLRVLSNHTDLKNTLQTHIPIVVKFLEAATRDGQGKLPHTVCDLVLQIIDVCHAPFSKPPPPASFYPPPTADDLSFFPKLPLRSGKGHYTADKLSPQDSRRKASYIFIPLTRHFHCILSPRNMLWGWGHAEQWISKTSVQHFST